METRWLYTTSENFPALVEASKGVCVIPMGCVEKHGLHLPLGADILQASRVVEMAAAIEPVCIFPDFTFGDVSCNAPVQPNGYMPAGSITLTVETEMILLEELCEQISRNGFKKILIFNGHGGNNPWLDTFLRKLANKKRDFVCGKIMMKLQAPHKMAELLLEKGSGAIPELTEEDEKLLLGYHEMQMQIGHACMGETAQMMGIAPESVRLDRLGIESGLSTHAADYLSEVGIQIMNGGWDINYPNAYHGHDPIGCNERIGKAALRLEAERVANAFRVFKEDEKLLRWHHEMQRGW